jgi:hypothetical protein
VLSKTGALNRLRESISTPRCFEATTFPIVIIAVERDNPGRALIKKQRRAETAEPQVD